MRDNKLNSYGLFNIKDTSKSVDDIKNTYNRIVKPLTNFAPYVYEDDANMYYYEEEMPTNTISINDEVQEEPKSFENFSSLIKARLKFKTNSFLNETDQQELISVVVQEVKLKYRELKAIIEDPLLTVQDNKELRRRIFVNVISICEKLFNHYIEKAEMFKSRNVFSNLANMTRLKTLLMTDLQNFINIHSLRRHLATDMKKKVQEDANYYIESKPTDQYKLRKNQIKDFVNDLQLNYGVRKRRYKTKNEQLKEIYEKMPVLETKSIMKLLQIKRQTPIQTINKSFTSDSKIEVKEILNLNEPPSDTALLENLSDDSCKSIILREKRHKSMFELTNRTLEEEFIINKEKIKKDRFKTTNSININFEFSVKLKIHKLRNMVKCEDLNKKDERMIKKKIKEDLDNLIQEDKIVSKLNKVETADDTPALLMASLAHPEVAERIKEKEEKLKILKEKRKKFEDEIKLETFKKTISKQHPQPDTVPINAWNGFQLKLSDVKISERIFKSRITLESFGPLYNEYNGEIDSNTVKDLDGNLHIGSEVRKVYEELNKTLNEDHLQFEMDSYVLPSTNNLDLKSSLISTTLINCGKPKFANNSLFSTSYKSSPWNKTDYREWNTTPTVDIIDPTQRTYRPLNGMPKLIKPFQPNKKHELNENINKSASLNSFNKSDFKIWQQWWKDHFTAEDFFKYLSNTGSDFLAFIFHFYDTKDGLKELSEEEMATIERKRLVERERKKIIEDLKERKLAYDPSVWNIQTVLLGGLGKDPELDDNADPLKLYEKSLEKPKSVPMKVNFFDPNNRAVEDNIIMNEVQNLEKFPEHFEEKSQLTPQHRLEKVWDTLQMSEMEKLNMVVKYCSNEYGEKLLSAIEDWEKVTALIEKRELFIGELETFEADASNPNRFFVKGQNPGSRLKEAKFRDNCHKKINDLEDKIKPLINFIENNYNDKIKYDGRLYFDKMKNDRVEMLHYLQEQRRKMYIENEIKEKKLTTNLLELCLD